MHTSPRQKLLLLALAQWCPFLTSWASVSTWITLSRLSPPPTAHCPSSINSWWNSSNSSTTPSGLVDSCAHAPIPLELLLLPWENLQSHCQLCHQLWYSEPCGRELSYFRAQHSASGPCNHHDESVWRWHHMCQSLGTPIVTMASSIEAYTLKPWNKTNSCKNSRPDALPQANNLVSKNQPPTQIHWHFSWCKGSHTFAGDMQQSHPQPNARKNSAGR